MAKRDVGAVVPNRAARGKKLSEEQIDRAIEDFNNGMLQKDVAAKYGVTAKTMQGYFKERRALANGKTCN